MGTRRATGQPNLHRLAWDDGRPTPPVCRHEDETGSGSSAGTAGCGHYGAALTGTGKTFLACALAHQACLQNRSVLQRRVAPLLSEIAEARAAGKLLALMRRIGKVELLVMDDWGLHSPSAEARRDLLEVVELRHARRSTIIASQLPVEEWHRAVGEGTIADAILDRLVNFAHHFELRGESMRRSLKPPPLDGDRTGEGTA